MPAIQRGQPYKLKSGKGWGLRYYDEDGVRRRKSPFPSKSAAVDHYRDVIEPRLRGESVPAPELTLDEFVPVYLKRHAGTGKRRRTIETLHKRLTHRRRLEDGETCRCATCALGDVPLRELERMSGELADWQAALPERSRYGVCRRSGTRSRPRSGGGTWTTTRPSWRAANRSRRRGRSASTRSPSWRRSRPSSTRATGRCPPSARRRGCGPRSGLSWSAAMSTAAPGRCGCGERPRAAKWSSWPRRPAPAARFRCRGVRSRR